MDSNIRKYTALGLITILIWGTSSVFTRSLSTSLGPFTAASAVNLIGGAVVIARQIIMKSDIRDWNKVSPLYWPVCGILFLIYTTCSYVSLGIAGSSEAVVMLVLIASLWPMFTLILTIPILKQKASPWLIVGVLLSFLGIGVAKLGGRIFDLPDMVRHLTEDGEGLTFLLGFVMALTWGLYTNLTKRFIADKEADGVGVYLIAAGLILGAIAAFKTEPQQISPLILAQIGYSSIVVSCGANVLWNLGIKRGNTLMIVLISNFLPVISTAMTSLIFGVTITAPVVIGSLLVAAGTIWSKNCFHSDGTGESTAGQVVTGAGELQEAETEEDHRHKEESS